MMLAWISSEENYLAFNSVRFPAFFRKLIRLIPVHHRLLYYAEVMKHEQLKLDTLNLMRS